jgi:hypothetical protein
VKSMKAQANREQRGADARHDDSPRRKHSSQCV